MKQILRENDYKKALLIDIYHSSKQNTRMIRRSRDIQMKRRWPRALIEIQRGTGESSKPSEDTRRVKKASLLTCNTHPVAEIDRIPYHRPIGDRDESLGVLI